MKSDDLLKQLEVEYKKEITVISDESLNVLLDPGCYLVVAHGSFKEWIETAFRNYLRTEREIFLVVPVSVCKTGIFHSKVVKYADITFINGTVTHGLKRDGRAKILAHYKPLPAKTTMVEF
jgi:hypothetical protein